MRSRTLLPFHRDYWIGFHTGENLSASGFMLLRNYSYDWWTDLNTKQVLVSRFFQTKEAILSFKSFGMATFFVFQWAFSHIEWVGHKSFWERKLNPIRPGEPLCCFFGHICVIVWNYGLECGAGMNLRNLHDSTTPYIPTPRVPQVQKHPSTDTQYPLHNLWKFL